MSLLCAFASSLASVQTEQQLGITSTLKMTDFPLGFAAGVNTMLDLECLYFNSPLVR